MSDGLATTLAVLQKTENEAAVRVLVAALDSPNPAIQDGALKALLLRRSRVGHREILRRFPRMPARWKGIVRQHQGRLTGALRDAVLGVDPQACLTACEAAVWFREYDLIPTLLNALDDRGRVPVEALASTILELSLNLYDELAAPRDYNSRRDPQVVRRHLLTSLEEAVARFPNHRRREVLEAFLLLTGRENAGLKKILINPHHPAFAPIIDLLMQSTLGGVVRLLLSFLDDPHVPAAVLNVIAKRSDLRFVQHLVGKLGQEPCQAATQNLRKLQSVAWLHEGTALLGKLDGTAQQGVVRLVLRCGIPRLQAFTTIEQLLLHGKPEGRRAAAEALAEFSGADANALAVRALDDPDPGVQANAARQLRRRGIPGVLPRLVTLLDSPHAEVRQAARDNLSEFTVHRFLAASELLDSDVRTSTAMLVRKADPRSLPVLREELQSSIRARRLRALSVVRAMDAVEQLEDVIAGLMEDNDPLIRSEAAVALAKYPSPASREVLERAQFDASETVREVAASSMNDQAEFLRWREALSDPRD